MCNNITIKASTFQSLAAHPNIVGCKLSHGDLSLHTQIASNPKIDSSHFATFTGLGQQLLAVLTVGGAGAIGNDLLLHIYCFGNSRRVAMWLVASVSKTISIYARDLPKKGIADAENF